MAGKKGLRRRAEVYDALDEKPVHSLVGTVAVPARTESPGITILKRVLIALAVIVATVLLVYFDRDGYRDTANPDDPLSLLDCFYYVTVSLSTTGYGDIVPVTSTARFLNVIVITPLRIVFLILLVGTTLAVLTEQSRQVFQIQRWRRALRNHTIVVGYGTKGRSAVAAMLADDTDPGDIVVVDIDKLALKPAESKQLVTVHGSATRSDILKLAGITRAKSIVVAPDSDDTAVLVTLSSRELAPKARIIATVRESENAHLLKQSGADQVVVSAETAGRLLGLATVTPRVVGMMEDLLTPDEGFTIAERPVHDTEVGGSPRHLADLVLGVVREGTLYKVNQAEVEALEDGDRLLYIKMVAAE